MASQIPLVVPDLLEVTFGSQNVAMNGQASRVFLGSMYPSSNILCWVFDQMCSEVLYYVIPNVCVCVCVCVRAHAYTHSNLSSFCEVIGDIPARID